MADQDQQRPGDAVGGDWTSDFQKRWSAISPVSRASIVVGSFILVLVIIGSVASSGDSSESDKPSPSYQACEVAVRSNGVDPYGSEGLKAIGRCMSQLERTDSSTDATTSGGGLALSDACSEFYRLVSDVTMTDEQSAAAFGSLAGRTEDPLLASELRDVASGFQRHDPAVSSEGINAICQ